MIEVEVVVVEEVIEERYLFLGKMGMSSRLVNGT